MSRLLLANREYRQMIASSLAEIRESGLLMDVTIVCGNQQFKAHKVILIASSGYFYSIFTKKLKTDIRQLAITDISPEILRMILDYIYTGTLNTHSLVRVKVEALKRALHYLDMTDVYRHRLNLMMKSLAPSYYAELWSMANRYQIKDMSNEISKFVASHLELCMDNAHFVVLTLQQLISVLSNEHVKQMPENVIIQAIQHWVLHDAPARDRFITSLLSVAKISAASRAKAAQLFDGEFQNALLSPNKKRITSPRSLKESSTKLKSASTNTKGPNYLKSSNPSEGCEKVIRVCKKKNSSDTGDDGNRSVGNMRKISVSKKSLQSRLIKGNDSLSERGTGTYICNISGGVGDNEESSSLSDVIVCNLTEVSDSNSSAFITCKSRSPVSPFSCFNTEMLPDHKSGGHKSDDDGQFIDCEKYPSVEDNGIQKKVEDKSVQRDSDGLGIVSGIKEHSYEDEKLQMISLKNKLNEIIQSIRGSATSSPDSSDSKGPPNKNINFNELQVEKLACKLYIKNPLEFDKKRSSMTHDTNDYGSVQLTSMDGKQNRMTQDRRTLASGDFQNSGTTNRPFSALSLPNTQPREDNDFSPRSTPVESLKSTQKTDDSSTMVIPLIEKLQKSSLELRNFDAIKKDQFKCNQSDTVYTSTTILHRPIATNSGSLISPEEVKSRLEKFKKIMYARNQNRVDIESINLKGSKSFIICNSTDSSDKSDGVSDSSENVIKNGSNEIYTDGAPEWIRTLSTIPEEASVSDYIAQSSTVSLYKIDVDVADTASKMVLTQHKQIKKKVDVGEKDEGSPEVESIVCQKEIFSDWSRTLSQVMEQQKQLTEETLGESDLESKGADIRKNWNIHNQETDVKNDLKTTGVDIRKKWDITDQINDVKIDSDFTNVDVNKKWDVSYEESNVFKKRATEEVEFWLQPWPKKYENKTDAIETTSTDTAFLRMSAESGQTNTNECDSLKVWKSDMFHSPRPIGHDEFENDVYPSPTLSFYRDSSSAVSIDDFHPDSLDYKSHVEHNDFISKTIESILSPENEQPEFERQNQSNFTNTRKSNDSFEFGGYQCFTESTEKYDAVSGQQPADALNITLQNLVRDPNEPKCGDDWKTWKNKLTNTSKLSSETNDISVDKHPNEAKKQQVQTTTTNRNKTSYHSENKQQPTKPPSVVKPPKPRDSNLTARTRIIDHGNSEDSDSDSYTTQTQDSVISCNTAPNATQNLTEDDYTLTPEMGPIIMLLTTNKTGTASQQLYSLEQRCWLTPRRLLMPPTEYSYAVCYLNERIYYIGGLANGTFRKMHEVYVYRLGDHVLVQATDLLVARVNPGVAHMHGFIYVAGGIGRYHKPIAQVERYNVNENRWQLVSALHVARSNISLVACGRLLFAIGGTVLSDSIGESVSKVCESYDMVIDQWSTLVGLPSHFNDYNPLVACVDGKLFAVRLWKPELVFRFHTNRNKWLPIQNTKMRINKICCLLPGERKLYAIELAGRTIHTFDMHAFQWEVETQFPKDVFWQAAAFVVNQSQ